MFLMKCDVLIIGAGPAGLFAANELADKLKVVVIDKGRDLKGRQCVALINGKCKRCLPCNITGGLGGCWRTFRWKTQSETRYRWKS